MYRYVDVLQDLLHSYNHISRTSIGMEPATVNAKNEHLVWQTIFHTPHGKKTKRRFNGKIEYYIKWKGYR